MLYIQSSTSPPPPETYGNRSLNLFLKMLLEKSLRNDQTKTSSEIRPLEQDPNDVKGSP